MKKPIIEAEHTHDGFRIIEVNGMQITEDHVSEMIYSLSELLNELENQKLSPNSWVYYSRCKEALKKAGVDFGNN